MNEQRTELDVLTHIEDLLTILVRRSVAQALETVMADDEQRAVYELTGEATVKEIAQRTGISTGKISGLWREWERAGLVLKIGAQYRKVA